MEGVKKFSADGLFTCLGRNRGLFTLVRAADFLTLAAFSVLIILFLFPASSSAGAGRLFRIGTGGLTGVYYPIGKLIAQGLTIPGEGEARAEGEEYGLPGYIGVAQNSAGSLENVKMVASGAIEAGLVQADVAAWAYKAENVFSGDESVGAIRAVASLYPEKFQIVVRRDAKVGRVQELRGKRISIDEIGSGTLSVMRIVLEAHGMSEKDLDPVYLKPVFTKDKVINGELQGFVIMAGAPMEAVTQLSETGITLVPIAPAVAAKIHERYPYLVPGRVPEGVYPGVPETPTIEVHALLVVSSAMDEELVYQVAKNLFSPRTLSLLHQGHPQGRAITLESALNGLSIPLHPGARRYYKEKGLLESE